MVSRGGLIVLTAMIGSAAAVLALLVAKLWPRESDALAAGSAKLLRRWRKFTGLDE
jgi:hypothetical protein